MWSLGIDADRRDRSAVRLALRPPSGRRWTRGSSCAAEPQTGVKPDAGPRECRDWFQRPSGLASSLDVSPTVFRDGPFRFFFFSREEERLHIHVQSPDGEAKFWIEPRIELPATISSAIRT
jgi:hypothetical protein